ncbi:MAG: S-layer homology domain-containing protein [Oscillospiraceae bacterium]|nr:S-layer homology domain-containing protein [Oscillospiraceae bacterium]
MYVNYKAILWAAKNGVTAGTSETTFSPKQTCTRAQIVTFLWRCINKELHRAWTEGSAGPTISWWSVGSAV